jgi:hypothetical protein
MMRIQRCSTISPDRLADANTKVDVTRKLVEKATNPDHVTKAATECLLAFNSVMSLKMTGSGTEIVELA